MKTLAKRYWKIEALVGSGSIRKRRVFLEGDWRVQFGRKVLVGKVVDAEGEAIEKPVPGGLSVEMLWVGESDIVGKCIEMEVSKHYGRLVPKPGEIVNCD